MKLDPITRPSLLGRLGNARDDEAWSDFSALYEPVIYSLARRRGLQDADAREIVQEVMLAVSRSIERFEPQGEGSFRGWLRQITRNATVDRLRRVASRREVAGGSDVDQRLQRDECDDKLETDFDLDHRRQLFRWAATEVRRRTGKANWMAFWKTCVEGLPINIVANELQLTPAAIYVARCRIIQRIRELVDERLLP